MKPGHVARPDMPVSFIKVILEESFSLGVVQLNLRINLQESLDKVRGHLVSMPLDFLEKEDLLAMEASVNPVTLQ